MIQKFSIINNRAWRVPSVYLCQHKRDACGLWLVSMRLLKNFITTLFFPIVKYTVKVYTPESRVRSDYELTVRIKGEGKQKTADHVLYETTQVRKKYDILSFVCLRVQGPWGHVPVTRVLCIRFRSHLL